MRVIKDLYHEKSTRSCTKCKSVLEISVSDIEYNYHFGHDSYYYYICGACGAKQQLPSSNIPASWKSYANEKMREAMGADWDD